MDDNLDSQGIEWVIRAKYENAQEFDRAKADLGDLKRAQGGLTESQQLSMRSMRMLAMSIMSSTISLAAMSGATKEQTRQLQTMASVMQLVITLMIIADALMPVAGAAKGGAAAMRGLTMLAGGISSHHQGGYGTDRLAVIRSDERVLPANRIMNNYGGNLNIGSIHISGNSGKDLARDFTEQLESYKQRGTNPPEWG